MAIADRNTKISKATGNEIASEARFRSGINSDRGFTFRDRADVISACMQMGDFKGVSEEDFAVFQKVFQQVYRQF